MNQDTEFGYKARQVLNKGVDSLERKVAVRLQEARQKALNMQRVPVRGLRLAGIGHSVELAVFPYARACSPSWLWLLALPERITGMLSNKRRNTRKSTAPFLLTNFHRPPILTEASTHGSKTLRTRPRSSALAGCSDQQRRHRTPALTAILE
jgi:hypothetical protein